MSFVSLKYNNILGIIQNDDYTMQITEWWSGEGVDVTIEGPPKMGLSLSGKSISLGLGEIEDLFALLSSMGFVDLDNVKSRANEITNVTDTQQKRFAL